ncbi:MAG: hypothetical protein Q4B22_05080 [Eubacteriales bacterium]|nr:hypothetical protein [Eubacteriales bacterium]
MKLKRIKQLALQTVLAFSLILGGSLLSAAPVHAADTVDMYRLYNPNTGEHFYTASSVERIHLYRLGWKEEGVGWVAPKLSSAPVYRLYNPNAGDHHYTTNPAERANLVAVGWSDEGIGWYSDDSKSIAVYRQYNPNAVAGSHNFTTSKAENDHLSTVGWKAEGIAWYAFGAGFADPIEVPVPEPQVEDPAVNEPQPAPSTDTDNNQTSGTYVLNPNSKVFHREHCPSVNRMNPGNRVYTTESRDSITGKGYKPCSNCRP